MIAAEYWFTASASFANPAAIIIAQALSSFLAPNTCRRDNGARADSSAE